MFYYPAQSARLFYWASVSSAYTIHLTVILHWLHDSVTHLHVLTPLYVQVRRYGDSVLRVLWRALRSFWRGLPAVAVDGHNGWQHGRTARGRRGKESRWQVAMCSVFIKDSNPNTSHPCPVLFPHPTPVSFFTRDFCFLPLLLNCLHILSH